MAVRIRLTRVGATKRPAYRVVAIDKRRSRDGRALEILGFYDPLTEPATVQLQSDRISAWIGKGAQPSDTVVRLMRQAERAASEPAGAEKPKRATSRGRTSPKKPRAAAKSAAEDAAPAAEAAVEPAADAEVAAPEGTEAETQATEPSATETEESPETQAAAEPAPETEAEEAAGSDTEKAEA